MPDMLDEKPDYVRLGPERYCRVYAIYMYPREINIGWLDEIFSVGEVSLSTIVQPAPDRTVIKELTEKVVSLQSTYMLLNKRGDIFQTPVLEQSIRDLETVRSAIQTNRDKMFYVCLTINIFGKNLKELNERSNNIEDILARTSSYARPLVFRQVEGLKTTLPLVNPKDISFWRNMTTGGITAMTPITNPDLSHPSGAYLGYNLFTKAPVFVDSFIGPPHLPNQHMAIFGFAGSGKSTTMKTMLARGMANGIRTGIIDAEREYQKLVKELLGGEVIKISTGRSSGINVLEIEVEEDDDGKKIVDIAGKATEVRALLAALTRHFSGRTMSAIETVYVEESVRELYAERDITTKAESLYQKGSRQLNNGQYEIGKIKKPMPTLTDLYEKLSKKPDMGEFAVMMKPLLRDSAMGMFDCESTQDMSSPVFCFDIYDIKDELTKFYAMYVILAWLWQKFALKNKETKKRIVIDESWMFIKYPESAQFLENVARRGRKHNCSLVLASQYIEEFLAREEGRAVMLNCATHFLLQQSPTVVDNVVETYKLAGGAKDYLTGFGPGQGLLILNGAVTAIYVEPNHFEWPYVTTTPGERS